LLRHLIILISLGIIIGCSPKRGSLSHYSFDNPPSIPDLATGKTKPPTADELQEGLSEFGHRWFFGPGFGRTAVNVGTAVVFPPYALYLVGQAVTRMAGYEPYTISDAIPEPLHSPSMVVYEGVTDAPGLLNSFLFGEQFQGEDGRDSD